MSAAAFFKEYIRNRRTIGAVVPSSPALARRITEAAEVWRAARVLELGPGTGALTQAIADSMPRTCQYLGIELNDDFAKRLGRQFPGLRFENAAAQNFNFDAALEPDEQFDVIVSGLPWASFPPELQTAILDRVLPRLAPGGRFATFAYWGFHKLPGGQKFRSLLHDRLHGAETTRVVWGNVPPAFVYVARA